MFELILLDNKLASTTDRVYAWGAFPLTNYDMNINEGKFKLPLILGKYNRDIDKFKDIEGKIKRNIDEWVCNLYINVRQLRVEECKGHKEKLEFVIPEHQRDLVDVNGVAQLVDKKQDNEEKEDEIQQIVIDEESDSDKSD